jgi:aspartyl-tRNA(Asn)/glutamyl-tRNA(Gln) amidotransferase subunit A
MPAALCGVVGHKFSAAAFPLEGIFPLSPTLDSPGTFTTSAKDAVTVWKALTGTGARADLPLRGLRLGKPAPLFYEELDAEVAQALDMAIERLAQAGAVIAPVEVPEVGEFEAAFGRIVPVELIDILGRERVRNNLGIFDPVTKARFSAVLDAPAGEPGSARAHQAALRAAVHARRTQCDAWITPSTPLVPGPLDSYRTLESALAWNRRALRNTRPGNVFDQCGISLPLPRTALPVGLQVLCPAMADAKLLAIACAIETVLNSPE